MTRVRQALAVLSDKEREILHLRFGIGTVPLRKSGTRKRSHRTPRLRVRFERTFQSSLKNQLTSFWWFSRIFPRVPSGWPG